MCPGTLGQVGQFGIVVTHRIVDLHCGTHGTCPGCPRGPGTLGWEGQCVWDCMSPIQHRTLGTFLNLSCKIGPVGFLGIVTANLDKCGAI